MRKSLVFIGVFALVLPLLFLGCEGNDGSQGVAGSVGPPGPPGPPGGTAGIQVESCVICHNGITRRDGQTHQELYEELYQDNVVQVTNLAYAFNPADNTDVVTFNMTKAGVDFDCREANTGLDSLNIYFVQYDGTNFQFTPPRGRLSLEGPLTYDGAGGCTSILASNDNVDKSTLNGLVVVYGREESLTADEEDPQLRFTRVAANKFPFAAVLETAAFSAAPYASAANNDGCEKCHTIPFLKHGYIYGQVEGDPATDFYTCKACHLDDGDGGHFVWQLLVNDPRLIITLEDEFGEDWEELAAADPRLASYQYKTRLMNDVHMSHAMEFPYPQSMSNCVVCHEGKLGAVLTDANFTGETCKSCHPVTPASYADKDYSDSHRAPALQTIWANAGVATFHNPGLTCNAAGCHITGSGVATFSDLHTGYDTTIYADAAGTKYSDVFVVTIDNASFVDNTSTLTFGFSATGSGNGLTAADIAPTVLVGLYGWDTKDYYVGPHERDFDDNGDGSVTSADQRNLEYVVGRTNHPRFTTVSSGGGSWVVTADLSAWADNVATGVVRQVEIAVLPTLRNPALDNAVVALNAPSRTFSLATNAFVANYYSGTNAIVRVDTGCNNCHDALADTFHSPDRGGNIVVCRLCHITKDAGSHLEFQSRSIDSYAHGIHSFQPFDINDVDFSDPVEALHYEDHIKFAFPTLGRENCESCHNPGKYNVPDQAKSLPGLLSASEFPIIFPDGLQRNIQQVPSYITGPATRACGGCHRVNWVNEDNASELAAFYGHTATNGYLVETESATHNVDVLKVIDEVMPMFYP